MLVMEARVERKVVPGHRLILLRYAVALLLLQWSTSGCIRILGDVGWYAMVAR